MIDFIETEKHKKFSWKWNIYLKKKLTYNDLYINFNEKNNIVIKSYNELLLKSHFYENETRKGYTCCDIIFNKIDNNEIGFYNDLNNFINFIIESFYKTFNKSLNKDVLKFINPLHEDRLNTYIAQNKNINKVFTNLININTLNKESLPLMFSDIYIYPELLIKNIYLSNKNIYIDIIITTCYIHKPIIKDLKIYVKHNHGYNNKSIMKLPSELIVKIMKIISENEDDLENFVMSSRYYFYLFINNYNYLHEKWEITSNTNRFNTVEWKYQKIKSILKY